MSSQHVDGGVEQTEALLAVDALEAAVVGNELVHLLLGLGRDLVDSR